MLLRHFGQLTCAAKEIQLIYQHVKIIRLASGFELK